jgi:dihydroxy-acid dehydratase
MGAISANVPAIFFPAGPMLNARWREQTLGSGSDVWKYWAERCAGNLCDDAWHEIENCIARSPGHCMTMGTASTMGAIAETLGMVLPGGSSIPAMLSEHSRLASATGRRIVQMVWEDQKPSEILRRAAFENAIVADMALSGSTNAIVHLIALARRAGVPLTMDDFDRLSRTTPVIANLRPAGKYLMEDFYNAGGLRALLATIGDLLHLDAPTVSGRTLGENLAGAAVIDPQVILPREAPLAASGGTFVLRGNLAPHGCVIKPTAADPALRRHRGPAVVFRDYNDLQARLNDPGLDVTPSSVLVLQSAGPLGLLAFPNGACCRSPTNCYGRGCATW